MSLLINLKSSFIFLGVFLLTSCGEVDNSSIKFDHSVEGAYAAEISENGDYSIISTINHGIRLWDNRENKVLFNWKHNTLNNDIFIVRISSDNTHALTASRSEFAIWDIKTGVSLGFYKVSDSTIRDIQISGDGRYILYGQTNGKLVHIDLKTGRRLEMPIHNDVITSVDLSDNGLYALSGGNDHKAVLWNTKTAEIIQEFHFKQRVLIVKLQKYGRYAFISDIQNASQIWNLKTGRMESALVYKSRQLTFTTARFIEGGRYLLTGSSTRNIVLWDTETGKSKQKWQVTPKNNIRPKSAVVYSCALWDSQTIASESSGGKFELWSLQK